MDESQVKGIEEPEAELATWREERGDAELIEREVSKDTRRPDMDDSQVQWEPQEEEEEEQEEEEE